MARVLLMRHGQDEDNARGILNGRRDTPLTAIGKEQACAAATLLRRHDIQSIYTSPLQRAVATAHIVADAIHVNDVIVHPLLIERDFGALTGKPLSDIPLYATRVMHIHHVNYFLDGDGVESFPMLYERAKLFLTDMYMQNAQRDVLIVTHGDIEKMIYAAYHEWPWIEGLRKPSLRNAEVRELSARTPAEHG